MERGRRRRRRRRRPSDLTRATKLLANAADGAAVGGARRLGFLDLDRASLGHGYGRAQTKPTREKIKLNSRCFKIRANFMEGTARAKLLN